MLVPYPNTKKSRSAERRAIRDALGTLSTPAPGPRRIAAALPAFAGLIAKATGGRFHLRVYDSATEEFYDAEEAAEFMQDNSFAENY